MEARTMVTGFATSHATESYAHRFLEMPGHFRKFFELTVSSIGIGTYLGEMDAETDRAYTEAIEAALLSGINLIDTAVNYRFQRSERAIRDAIANLVGSGQVRRDEFLVATKGGYLTFDGEYPSDPHSWIEERLLRTGLIRQGELIQNSHCLAPRYIDKMLDTSRINLGLKTIDIYYLHNPEAQLDVIDRAEFRRRMLAAFELLEQKVKENAIRFYGVATWNGFRIGPNERGYLSLAELLDLAQKAGGNNHHFKFIQLPFNFAMPEALTRANQELEGTSYTLLAAAQRAGMAVCASASLLQGRLAHNLPAPIGSVLRGFSTDAQRSLQFVRSAPGVAVALAGMSSAGHVLENVATAKVPPAPLDTFQRLFGTEQGE